MEKVHEARIDSFDEIFGHLEEVYGNAQWALRYGATKESLLAQIDQSFELHQDALSKEAHQNTATSTEQSTDGLGT